MVELRSLWVFQFRVSSERLQQAGSERSIDSFEELQETRQVEYPSGSRLYLRDLGIFSTRPLALEFGKIIPE
jgi:hypothetical protein